MRARRRRARRAIPLCLLAGLPLLGPTLADAAESPAPDLAGSGEMPERVRLDLVESALEIVDGQWIQYGTGGFTLQADQRHLLGEAIRYDLGRGRVFATGSLVLRMPGLRLHADHLGADDALRRGEAWNVLVVIYGGRGDMRLRASRISFDQRMIRLEGVRADAGHGGLLGFGASAITVHLREQPNPRRYGAERHLSHITASHPFLKVGPLPIFYSPYLYRDFNLDYPWTRYEFGSSSRQGDHLRFWTRADLPPLAGWHLRTYGRFDYYERVGTAFGLRPEWRHERFGRGEFLWYGFDEEKVRRSSDGPPLAHREAHVIDLEHRLPLPGGGIAGRWTRLPDPDPAPAPADERFRADYLRDDLDHRPFARRGVTGAWAHGVGGLVLGSEQEPQPDTGGLARDRAAANLPDQALVGPLHVAATGDWSALERERTADEAERTRWDVGLGLGEWTSSGIGFDLQGGLRGIGYRDAVLGGTEVANQARQVPYLSGGLGMRFQATFASGLKHTIVPRVGAEWLGRGAGDELGDFDFDSADRFEEDLALGVVGLQTRLVSRSGRYFSASVTSRWALRSDDAPRDDPDGVGDHLHDVAFDLQGRPIATLDLDAQGRWSGTLQDWQSFDFSGDWIAHEHLVLGGTASWRLSDETWQYRPRLDLIGNRYRAGLGLTWEQGEAEAGSGDRLLEAGVILTRRMIDGDLSLTYDWVRLDEEDDIDRRIGVSFSLTGFSLR